MKTNWFPIAFAACILLCAPAARADSKVSPRGTTLNVDGSFSYQGFLELNGEPANGSYSFRFEAFDDPGGFDIAHELYFVSPLIPVVDGIFVLDVVMGGTPSEARRFWREIGDQEIYFAIGVAEVEGGSYTTLSPLTKLGWSARAQYSAITESLRFPYADIYSDPMGDPNTMISLTSTFGGTILQAIADQNRDEAIIDVQSATATGDDYGAQNGAVHIDAAGRLIGMFSIADEFPIAGIIHSDSEEFGAAVLGQVSNGASNATGVFALNLPAGNSARLAGPTHAGSFSGDVHVDGDLQITGDATRNFALDPAPIGPAAYGFINASGSVASGTANMSCLWDVPNARYSITLSDQTLSFGACSAIVTVVDTAEPRVATTNTVGNTIVVKIWDLNSGNIAIQDNFQIAIYVSDPASTLLNPPPPGVDPEHYYAQTRQSPIVVSPERADRFVSAGAHATQAMEAVVPEQ